MALRMLGSLVALSVTVAAHAAAPPALQCFEVKRHVFADRSLGLVDRLDAAAATVERPDRLCLGANVADRDPGAPSDPRLLTGFGTIRPFAPVALQQVATAFGSGALEVRGTGRVLVPTAEGAGPPPGTIDHFACYAVVAATGFTPVAGIKVVDRFGTQHVKLRRPVRLCMPANPAGEQPGAEAHPDALLCYAARGDSGFPDASVALTTRFGASTEHLIRRTELCLPAVVGPATTTTVPATTTTTSTAASTTTSTSSPVPTTTSTTTPGGTTTSTTTPGATTTSTTTPGGTTTSTTTPGATTTSTTTPGGTTTSTTTPGSTSTSTTTPGGTTTSTTTPGATTTSSTTVVSTTSTTSTTLVTCGTAADCPDTTCQSASCTDGVCHYSPIASCPLCTPSPEVCSGGGDEDCDGLVDCHDPDCADSPGCEGVEICGNCIDDDGDGLVDFDDPDCCAATATLALDRLRLRATPAHRTHDRVRLGSVWTFHKPDGFDPLRQDTSVQITDARGLLFCKTIAAMHWMPRGKRSVAFWDMNLEFAGGLSDGRFTVRRNGSVAFRTHGPTPDMRSSAGGPVHVAVRVGTQCTQLTGTLRGKADSLVVRRHGSR